ncbi:MAG: TonB-dependent receptor [Piscirickettsiaceae bacterium]|nr:TonB-dependent receptor [Piscirickettsiaceae bacterium]
MSYRHLTFIPLALPLLATPVFAESLAEFDTMVVTATRTPTNINQLGSSITVISSTDIERRQFQTLTDALQDVPGLHIVQSGVKGSQTSVFMRGSNSDHTLVLIDGIEMNDPSSPNGAFDFANFLIEDIESIEIVRGSQSVLYGADAIGGVIHIRTKKGDGKLKVRGKAEVGTHSTHHETLAISGSSGGFNYSATLGLLKTDGDSVATEKRLAPGSTIEDDGYDNKVFSAKLGWQPSSLFEVNLTARYIETEVDIDGGFDFSGNTVEDPDATNDSEQLYLSAEFKGNFIAGVWQPTLLLSKIDIDRKNRNGRDNPFGTLDRTDFHGEKTKFSLQNDLFLFDKQILTIGFEHEDEEMNSKGFTDFGGFIINQLTDADRQTKSAYIQNQINFNDRLFATLGARYDDPDDFNSEVTYRATTSYQATDTTRLRAAYGTGFKAPSLFQLFGHTPNNFGSEFRGNPNLDPETSKGWEIGFDQSLWQNRINTSLTYFKTDIDDLITTVFLPSFDSTTVNLDDVDMHGIESTIRVAASSNIDIHLNYTFTRTKDEDDKELLRRPKHKASIDVEYRPTDKMTLSASLLHTGSRKDVDGFGSRVKMSGYSVINIAANYQVNESTRIFTRIDNFGNKTYEPAYGFQALGMTGYIGIELTNQ